MVSPIKSSFFFFRFFILILSSKCVGQTQSGHLSSLKSKPPDYIIWEKGDTSYCNIISIERVQGNISAIDYINNENQKVSLRNNFEVSKAKFISVNNEFFWEYIRLNEKKSASCRHLEVEANGKIKIFSNKQLTLRSSESGEKIVSDAVNSWGGVSMTIKTEGENYFDLNKNRIKKEIIPYLMRCEEFRINCTQKIEKQNIIECVKIFNMVCK